MEQIVAAPAQYQALGRKIALAIAGVAFIPYALIFAVFYSSYHQSIQDQVGRTMGGVITSLLGGVQGLLRERAANLKELTLLAAPGELENPAWLAKALGSLRQAHGSFLSLALLDARGAALAGTLGEGGQGGSQDQAPLVKEALEKGPALGDLFIDQRGAARFRLAVASPGQPGLALVASLEAAALTRQVDGFQLGRTGEALLLDRSGQPQSQPGPLARDLAQAQASWPALARGQELAHALTSQGRRVVIKTVPVGWAGWSLVCLQDEEEAFGAFQEARRLALGVGALGGLFVMGVAFFFTRRLVARLARADAEKGLLNEIIIQSGKLAALGELAEGVAHQINNPLAIMLEEAGWLHDLMTEEKGLLDKSRHRDEFLRALAQMQKQGARCKQITTKLLGFAHHTHATPQPTQVNDLIREVADIIARPALYANVNLRLELAPDLPLVAMSPSELQQVVINLVNNALDAMEKTGGQITLATRRAAEDSISVTVADSGPGIPAQTRAHIFDPFFTTKPKGKGTGLGLSICHSLVARAGGHIELDSRPGQGTAFTVVLPRNQEESPRA